MPEEIIIENKKVKLYDTSADLLKDYKIFRLDLLITYNHDDKIYYHADTKDGNSIGILEKVVFGEPPEWGYYCKHFKDVE